MNSSNNIPWQFKPSLKAYENFANSIGFKLTHNKKGVLVYKSENIELMPFELGNIYKFCNKFYSKGIDESLTVLEYSVKKSKTFKELQETLNNFIKEMKEESELCKNKLK